MQNDSEFSRSDLQNPEPLTGEKRMMARLIGEEDYGVGTRERLVKQVYQHLSVFGLEAMRDQKWTRERLDIIIQVYGKQIPRFCADLVGYTVWRTILHWLHANDSNLRITLVLPDIVPHLIDELGGWNALVDALPNKEITAEVVEAAANRWKATLAQR